MADGATGATGATGALGATGAQGPQGAAGSGSGDPVRTRALIANYGINNGSTVSMLDVSTNAVVATIAVGASPYAAAASAITRRAYIGNIKSNEIDIIDINSATSFKVPVGAPSAAEAITTGIGIHPAGTRIYVARWDTGTVHVLDAALNSQVATISVGSNPYNIAFTPAGNRAYVTNPNGNKVSVIDVASNAVTATLTVGTQP